MAAAATTEKRPAMSTEDATHLALMDHCLELTLNCDVVPTAFCVGSSLFLPSSSPHFTALKPFFDSFPSTASAKGLILADGWSRQIPGNTHAEANALVNFREKYAKVEAEGKGELPKVEEVLRGAECFATMEPCSIRTSGGPSCALDLVRAQVKTVYLGVEEPPDFVQCEGVQILQDGGVDVVRVIGREEECLKAARRGRD
ncbi:hypothetical protein IAT38_006049 [Cryptococcus sp. DSM 104549]